MSRRADAVRRTIQWLVRGALLATWALAGWGTLLLLATTAGALRDGPGVALARLVPPPGASLWAWLNSLTAALALAGWLIALGLFIRDCWQRRALSRSPSPKVSPPGHLSTPSVGCDAPASPPTGWKGLR